MFFELLWRRFDWLEVPRGSFNYQWIQGWFKCNWTQKKRWWVPMLFSHAMTLIRNSEIGRALDFINDCAEAFFFTVQRHFRQNKSSRRMMIVAWSWLEQAEQLVIRSTLDNDICCFRDRTTKSQIMQHVVDPESCVSHNKNYPNPRRSVIIIIINATMTDTIYSYSAVTDHDFNLSGPSWKGKWQKAQFK